MLEFNCSHSALWMVNFVSVPPLRLVVIFSWSWCGIYVIKKTLGRMSIMLNVTMSSYQTFSNILRYIMRQAFEPPPSTGGYPRQTAGIHLIFTRFRLLGSLEMHIFHCSTIQCGAERGHGMVNGLCLMFRRRRSSLPNFFPTRCPGFSCMSLIVKVNAPGIPQLGRWGELKWLVH